MLSKTAEDALRTVTCLASQAASGKASMSAEEVAGITKVPRRYLHRVMQHLADADLVNSHRGVQGGDLLTRPADTITILDVVHAVEPVGRICDCPLNLLSNIADMLPVLRRISNPDELCEVLCRCCWQHAVGNRPDGYEPRVAKRRQKNDALMRKPSCDYKPSEA